MFNLLIDELRDNGLLSDENALFLKTMEILTYSELTSLLTNTHDKQVILALCEMVGISNYVSCQIDKGEVIDSLVHLLDFPDWEIRQASLEAIGLIDGQSDIKERLFEIALRDEHEEVRLSALYVLGQSKDPFSLPTLESIAMDISQSVKIRERAIESIGEVGSKMSTPMLLDLLQEESIPIKHCTIIALYNIADKRAIHDLEAFLTDETHIDTARTLADEARDAIAAIRHANSL